MIPLIKPYLPPKEELMEELETVLYSGYIAEGKYVYEFEEKLKKLLGNPFCLATSSGTGAIHIALSVLSIGIGDEVISTAMTAEPTNTTIAITGAKIVFADIDVQTGLLLPESIEANITKNTKAIMLVHYAGMVCDMDRINEISKKHNIPVIEDASHAFLSKYNDKYIGSNSRFTLFSFQAIKQLTTIDGGLLCLTSEMDYERAKKFRWFGLSKSTPRLNNNIIEAGFKYNMNNVNAVIGLTQLNHLHENVFKYMENGKYYDYALKEIDSVTLVPYYQNTEPSYWLYTIIVDRRSDFIEMMEKAGITASPLHLRNDRHDVFKPSNKLPNLDIFYEKFVHIPCGWWVTEEDRKYIVDTIKGGW
jgi:perosamine synthetase